MTLTTTQMIILGSIGVAIIIVIAIIVANTKKSILKKEIDDLNIRFNTIKTIPIAFKLNKAQAMAKRIEDTSEKKLVIPILIIFFTIIFIFQNKRYHTGITTHF